MGSKAYRRGRITINKHIARVNPNPMLLMKLVPSVTTGMQFINGFQPIVAHIARKILDATVPAS